ncbi:MAG: helix-turn-helix transcriptional regulator, partial [Anaerolineales bacterium]|nr:helix-turn-helix transcriptional regulator [Anaerolineales bacterium]
MTNSLFRPEYKSLLLTLAQARQDAGFTQTNLALQLGKPQSYVSKYENGERKLDVIEFLDLCHVLGIDPAFVFSNLQQKGLQETTILDRWEITPSQLTSLLEENPSLRGMLLGYVAELKLREMIISYPEVSYATKFDDHDRKQKGDLYIIYRGHAFDIESKSLQTKMVQQDSESGTWLGKAQVDASDRREVVFEDGTTLNTTLLLRGEFDVLAVNLYAFEEEWRFVFARNSDLPTSRYKKYTPI